MPLVLNTDGTLSVTTPSGLHIEQVDAATTFGLAAAIIVNAQRFVAVEQPAPPAPPPFTLVKGDA